MVEADKPAAVRAGNILDKLGLYLNTLSRRQKKAVLVGVDLILLPVCLLLSYWLRLGDFLWDGRFPLIPYFIVSLVGVGSFWATGFYRNLIRAFDFRSVNTLFVGCFVTSSLLALTHMFSNLFFMPRSIPFIFLLLSFVIVGSSRVFARWLYNYSVAERGKKRPVLILGAGDEGNQIASILSGSSEFSLIGFLEEDRALVGNYMRGRKVYGLDQIDQVRLRYANPKIFVSFQDLTPSRKSSLYQQLARPGVEIEIIPPLSELIAGRTSLQSARELRIEDFLGRDAVQPMAKIFSDAITGSAVLVPGGGGSIGSELCRQVLTHRPGKLIVLEQSEFALYQIEASLKQSMAENGFRVEIVSRLGSADDRALVRRLLAETRPDFVFHAAAYKHVPIVEDNILEGVRNNILSTVVLASECAAAGVKRFTLISTDKAVRPTNVMGATKRAAELIIQAFAEDKSGTVFSMVRFGNVLGSSGSVIPVFMDQIRKGGPVTVTHKEITRYFMTIPEAAQLVIQASFLAEGGEVFVLDMGDPVKIRDLARLAIQLNGYSVKDEEHPDGDIAIEYIGLRPGEKLYEELLIDNNVSSTVHPQIMKADETRLPFDTLMEYIELFREAVDTGNADASVKLLEKIVAGFRKQ